MAADPMRAALCKQPAGVVEPVVDFSRCEGKGDCVRVCPAAVFELRRIDDVDYRQVGLIVRLKLRVHGMQVAYTPHADACQSCGSCVAACPQNAIELRRHAGHPRSRKARTNQEHS